MTALADAYQSPVAAAVMGLVVPAVAQIVAGAARQEQVDSPLLRALLRAMGETAEKVRSTGRRADRDAAEKGQAVKSAREREMPQVAPIGRATSPPPESGPAVSRQIVRPYDVAARQPRPSSQALPVPPVAVAASREQEETEQLIADRQPKADERADEALQPAHEGRPGATAAGAREVARAQTEPLDVERDVQMLARWSNEKDFAALAPRLGQPTAPLQVEVVLRSMTDALAKALADSDDVREAVHEAVRDVVRDASL